MHSIYSPIAILSPGNGTLEKPTDIVSELKLRQHTTKPVFPYFMSATNLNCELSIEICQEIIKLLNNRNK